MALTPEQREAAAAARRKPPEEKRDYVISFKLSRNEIEEINGAARDLGMTKVELLMCAIRMYASISK